MTSPVDPIRRNEAVRRARRASDRAGATNPRDRNLPVVLEPAVEAAPPPEPTRDPAGVFAAHMLGQDGQKRGLRGGPPVLNAAKDVYSRTEWSGPADRRAPKGKMTKTEI